MERRPDGTVGVTRQELHELVWAKPRREVAASMGVTDFMLADACRKAAVPTPPAGHWTKVSMGKASGPIPLPPAPEGIQEQVTVGRAPKPSVPEEDPKPLLPAVPIPDELKDPHALVAEAHASLARQAAAGDTTLLWRKTGCFHINVGIGSMDRALRILDAVLKAIEAKGHRVTPGKWKWRVTMGAAHIGMRLEADYKQVPRKPKADDLKWMLRSPGWQPPATEWIPTSSLTLRMEGYGYGLRKTFSDGKRQSLESLAPEIVTTILAVILHSEREKAEREESERRWAEERTRREEVERRRREEEERIARLKADAASWHEVTLIRGYVATVRAKAGDDVDEAVARWLEWAAEIADRADPLSGGLPRRPRDNDEGNE